MMEFNYKIEDFNDIAPYEELEKIEDPFKKQIAENQLEAYAKKLGFKAFKKTLAGYRKSLKAPFEDATDYKVSDFQGQEFELKLKQWNGYGECSFFGRTMKDSEFCSNGLKK